MKLDTFQILFSEEWERERERGWKGASNPHVLFHKMNDVASIKNAEVTYVLPIYLDSDKLQLAGKFLQIRFCYLHNSTNECCSTTVIHF